MSQTRRRHSRAWIAAAAILVALAILPYLQTLGHEFVCYDDEFYVVENPHVRPGVTMPGIAWAFTTFSGGNWHPLTWVSHMLDTSVWGLKPAGHHFTNLMLHAANTLLLFLVFARMTGALWRSALVAALFAVHPLHVESVAWVAERKDVLSTFFGLLAAVGLLQIRARLFSQIILAHVISIWSRPDGETNAGESPMSSSSS